MSKYRLLDMELEVNIVAKLEKLLHFNFGHYFKIGSDEELIGKGEFEEKLTNYSKSVKETCQDEYNMGIKIIQFIKDLTDFTARQQKRFWSSSRLFDDDIEFILRRRD